MAKAMRFMAGMALSFALAAPALAQDPTADTVIATVNGTNITLGNMIVARESLPEQYKSLPPDVLFKGILDQLVQQTVLEQSVADKLTKKDTLQLENDRRSYLSNTALKPVVTAAVSDEALQKAYDEKFKDSKPGTEYHAAHILVDTEEKANELKAELAKGAVFADLAKANSTDTGSGAQGGDLGWFGLGAMVKPFEDAVVASKVGEVSGPIKSDFGWHLILVSETRVAAKPTLDELRDELAQGIEQKVVEEHIKALTEAAKIEKPGEGIDPKFLGDAALLDK
ncbi:peptidylprolyl isomerase [Cypionkella aquatica]|uniref:Parvulin-like PPIase n=1 Tax=Cypionkella aquatica TaxID=1756042 RepID=A0AA37TUV6_9RHOB|nr:peptidylprolyl isomerase [Cypionkella aquatica]GLS86280.1 peptidylprolyl isomerase [Cypionkella aquatica]